MATHGARPMRPLRVGATGNPVSRPDSVPLVPRRVPVGPVAPDRRRPTEEPGPASARTGLPESHIDRLAQVTLDFYAALVDEDRDEMEQTGTILWHAIFHAGLVS